MYLNETLFDLFCLGIESGNFKHTESIQPTKLSDLITPSHETHFRAELWWVLPHASWRHNLGRKHANERIAKWREFLPLVRADRNKNEAEAYANRTAAYAEHGVGHEVDPETDVGNDVSDAMYWD
jgi:hypothetical protein